MVKDYSTHEVVKNDMFGFTLKINDVKEPRHEDYMKIIQKISTKVELSEFIFEDKTKKGMPTKLHIHGVFKCPKNPYFKSIVGKGVHIKVERIYDTDGWHRYCNKNTASKLEKNAAYKDVNLSLDNNQA